MASSFTSKTRSLAQQTVNGAKGVWQQSWSQYKFTSPAGERQTHYESIRTAISEKYGSYATPILMILSAVVTDAVFWWLTELLLDDGM